MTTWNFQKYVVTHEYNTFTVHFNGEKHATITPKDKTEEQELIERFNNSEGVNGLVSDDNQLIYLNVN